MTTLAIGSVASATWLAVGEAVIRDWMGHSMGMLMLLAVSVLAAGAVAGLSGFGFNLLSVPLLLLVLSPREGIVVSLVAGISVTGSMLLSPELRRHIDRPTLTLLLVSSVAGVPVGLLLFAYASEALLAALVGMITLLYALAVLTSRLDTGSPSMLASVSAGAASGALAASTGLSGPPAVLLAHYRDLSPPRFRATLTAYFFVISGVSVALLLSLRLAPPDAATTALALMPPAVLGMVLGRTLFNAVPETLFRRLVLVALLVMGAVNVVNVIF